MTALHPVENVVVGIDPSPASVLALKFAADEAQTRGVPLKILYVWQIEPSPAMAGAAVPWQAIEADSQAVADQIVDSAIGANDAAGEPRDIQVVNGVPGPTLVAACGPNDLLVVGTRVHTGLQRLLHGSVSRHCLNHAPCAVLAVPDPVS